MDRIAISVFDAKYFDYAVRMYVSLRAFNPDLPLFAGDMGLTRTQRNMLEALGVSVLQTDRARILKERGLHPNFSDFLLHSFLKDIEWSQVAWIDADTMVFDDLSELFSYDVDVVGRPGRSSQGPLLKLREVPKYWRPGVREWLSQHMSCSEAAPHFGGGVWCTRSRALLAFLDSLLDIVPPQIFKGEGGLLSAAVDHLGLSCHQLDPQVWDFGRELLRRALLKDGKITYDDGILPKTAEFTFTDDGTKASSSEIDRFYDVVVRRKRWKKPLDALMNHVIEDKYTQLGTEKLRSVDKLVTDVVRKDLPGELVECGAWRGGSALVILNAAWNCDKVLHLFDTFKGMPPPSKEDFKGTETYRGKLREEGGKFGKGSKADTSVELVRGLFDTMGMDLSRLTINKARIGERPALIRYLNRLLEALRPVVRKRIQIGRDLLSRFPEQISFLHINVDSYEPCRWLLYHLYRRIPHGGIIVFDDYGHWIGAKRAVDEFLKESGETLHTTTTTQSFVVKTQDIHEEALFFVGGIEPVGVAQWAEQARLPQQALYDALRYFLYGSLRSSRFRYLFRRGGGLRAAPLAKVVEAFERVHVPRGRWPSLPTNSSLTDTAFAEFLGEAYHVWEEILSQADKGQTTHCRLPLGKRYEEWIREGGNSSKYRPVHSLRSLLCLKRSEDLFLRAIVHGSVATLDDTPGFSDLDLAFMVRSSALKSSKSLLDLRKLASAILIQTYAFDPFMHHGPYYLAEIDLNWYPEAMLPMVLFSHGVDLLDGSAAVEVWTRPSFDMTLQMLDRFEKSFENWASSPFVLADSYALEWVLGNAMILPALYLQGRTGRFRYKRDTFPLAQGGFSSEEWEPIRLASAVRTSLGGRPKPSELLVRLAQWLEWPGLLQAWERRRPASLSRAQKAAKTLGADYPQRVLLLLRAMKKKLSETRSQAGTV